MTDQVQEQPAAVVDIEKKRKRVIGRDAEAALAERHAKAREAGDLYYSFRGVEYRVLDPLPAAVLLNATQIQNGDDVDLTKFVTAVSQAFHADDRKKFIDDVLNSSAENAADFEYLADVLNEVVEAATARPTNK